MGAARIESGSFRDPHSRVVEADGAVLRLLSEQGLRDWNALAASELFKAAVADGKLVGTEVEPEDAVDLPDGLVDGAAAVLRHEVVPFVSYPYEWTFAMLKDAALLQLEPAAGRSRREPHPQGLLAVQRPVAGREAGLHRRRLVRVTSGGRAVGRLPPVLHALPLSAPASGVQGRPVPALAAGQARRDRAAGVPGPHVVPRPAFGEACSVTSFSTRGSSAATPTRIATSRGAAGGRLQEGADRRERDAAGKACPQARMATGSYGLVRLRAAGALHGCRLRSGRIEFVRRAAAERTWELVWDLGCNDGTLLADLAEHARYVVAMDADPRSRRRPLSGAAREGETSILPLLVDIVDPSPALGWRGARAAHAERPRHARADALPRLIHHVSISGNVPVREFLDWLRSLGDEARDRVPDHR